MKFLYISEIASVITDSLIDVTKYNIKNHSHTSSSSFLSCSQGRNAWTFIVSVNFRISPFPAAPVKSPTGPNTAECVQMNAAASLTSRRQSRWSLSVPMEQCLPGSTCGLTHASAISPAETPMIFLLTWSLTMSTMRSWTETERSDDHRFSSLYYSVLH